MENKFKSIVDCFQNFGLLFPTSEKEVEIFEANVKPFNREDIPSFNNPIEVLKKGYQQSNDLNHLKIDSLRSDVENLSMAAREGGVISSEVRNKMNNDRNDSKKK